MTSDISLPGDFQAGDLVGNTYEVLGYIGRGAMGHVYRVRHTGLTSEYALKTLSKDYVNEAAWRRFQNEAQAISILQHPNVVSVFNLGLHNNELPFYVMDLLVGMDLAEKIRKEGPLETKHALAVFIEVCAGISYAHKKGIVHRDIKPSNVFLLERPGPTGETIKVVDFGIAKLTRAKDQTAQALTGVGDVLGTPFYMSPEQSVGKRVDARSDIYSLGCTLFEALTGAVPFRGRNATETMLMHNSSIPPSLQKASGGRLFPESLEAIIARTLEKAPADRYQTMDRLAEDLASFIETGGKANGDREHAIVAGDNEKATVLISNAEAKSPWRKQMLTAPVVAGMVAICALVILLWTASLNNRPQNAGSAGKDQLQSSSPGEAVSSAKNIVAPPSIIDSSLSNTLGKFLPGWSDGAPTDLLSAQQSVTASLRADKPFSTIEVEGRKQFRVFRFPDDVVVGAIKVRGSEKSVFAVGILKYPKSAKLWFSPSKIVGEYPRCMQRFQPDEIDILRIAPQACSDQIVIACQVLTRLRRLNLSNCTGLTSLSIPALSHFQEIETFNASDSDTAGPLLAEANCWDKVTEIDYSGAKEPLPFLVRLKSAKLLTRLSLSRSKLAGADFKALSALSQLTNLDLFQVPMTKQDLSVLSALDNLSTLRIGESGLSGSDLDALKNFKSLTWLDLCGNPLTKKDLAYLIGLREFKRLDLQRTGIALEDVSVLKDYKCLRELRIGDHGRLKKGELEKIQAALPGVKVR